MREEIRNYMEELLANQPCPINTWIHLQSCPKCSQQLEALRKLSDMFSRAPFETLERDPLFYARVQARIEYMRRQSPWRVFLDTGFAKRLVLTCLACIGFIAAYLFGVGSEEYSRSSIYRSTKFTSPEPADRRAQRDAVLVNLVVDSKPINEANH